MLSRLLLLAGEESGLVYARRLTDALRRRTDAPFEVRTYADYGFKTHDLAVMGILPVIKKIFYFLGVARTMKRAIRTWRPDVVVTVDYPGMNLKLAAYAKAHGIPAVHVVCPQVWAWKRGRIPGIAQALTRLLCFFPFEPALFRACGSPGGFAAKFIGHPLVDVFAEERGKTGGDLPWGAGKRVALLPGSRKGEIERILPRLAAAADLLRARVGAVSFLVPAATPRARRQIDAFLAQRPVQGLVVVDGRARDVLRGADVAAVASGTATLEAAFARVPTALVYATTPSFAWFLRYFVTGVRFAGLVNVVAERCSFPDGDPPKRRPGEGPGKGGPMPELLQEDFTPEALVDLLAPWLAEAKSAANQLARTDAVLDHLRVGSEGALDVAAGEVLACVK